MAKKAVKSKKKVSKVSVTTGIVHIHATFNNTIVTISDMQGNVITWATAGGSGFKGSRKSTPYAAGIAAKTAGKEAKDRGLRVVDVRVKGPGTGREAAIQAVSKLFTIVSIEDVTGIPHNGCRSQKERRA